MKKCIIKMLMILVAVAILLLISPSVKAASAKISANSTNVYVGDKVTVSAIFTAASWNLTISGNGVTTSKYADVTSDAENATKTQSVNLDTSKEGSYTIKLTGDVTDGTTGETTNVNSSVTVVVKAKPVEQPKENNSNNNNGEQKANIPVTTNENKKEVVEKPKEEKKEEKKEEELQFGISKLILYGIDENNKKNQIALTPEFNINTYEYKCNVDSNIKKIEIEKNANNYDKYLQIVGIDEELQYGENIIILKMLKDNKKIEYKITIDKAQSVEVISIEDADGVVNLNGDNDGKEDVVRENKIIKIINQHKWCIVITLILMVVEAIVFIKINNNKNGRIFRVDKL